MGADLHVDPDHVKSAASAQSEVAAFVGAMQPGSSMSAAAGGMSELQTANACDFIGSVFDSAASTVSRELADHADKLSTAANRYGALDEELGRRLRKFSEQ